MSNKEIVRVETVNENERGGKYKLYFMDELYCTYHCSKVCIEEIVKKRQRAYDLIPDGCRIIPKRKIKEYEGKLVGGILEDSIVRVFGVATNDGIRGYSCSVYFIPSQEYFKSIIPDDTGLEVKVGASMKNRFINFLKDNNALDEYKKEILPFKLENINAEFHDGGACFLLQDGCIFFYKDAVTGVNWKELSEKWEAACESEGVS